MITTTNWTTILQQLFEGQSLSTLQAADLMNGWLKDDIPAVLSGAILAAIQAKGVSAEELLGMIQVLQHQAVKADRTVQPFPVVDTCGTGGDGASTFNISTAVAFTTAATGIKVAKHGNRSASSKTGSADVLEALGVNLSASPQKAQAALDQVGITFLFAPDWHPALKAIAPLRKTLKVRTVFNLLGPLLNPLHPTGQVIGVNHPSLVNTFAEVLQHQDIRRAVILYGRDRLDEAGLGDKSDVAIVDHQQVQILEFDPQDLGIPKTPIDELRGGTVLENAAILKAVLSGKGTPAQQNVVALNTAFALYVGEAFPETGTPMQTFAKAVTLAKEILQSGRAWEKLEQLASFRGC
jgi:anthranilate phosphoribosyltransferase